MIFQMCFYFGIVGVCLDHAKVAIFVDSNLFWQRATLTPMEHHNNSLDFRIAGRQVPKAKCLSL